MPHARTGSRFLLAFLAVGLGASAAVAQLPGTNGWQAVLRTHLATFTEDQFRIDLQPLTYASNHLAGAEAVYRHWIRFENRGYYFPQSDGLRALPQYFVLTNIEANGQINMNVGRGRFFDPGILAWWSQWDYPGNPCRPGTTNSIAARRRAFTGAAVDLIMLDDLHRRNPGTVRSDYMGGSLIWQAYTYGVVRDSLPAEVRAAYETGLRTIFDRLDKAPPSGSGGGDMETFQLVGAGYVAAAIDDYDLRQRALARCRYVLDQIIMPAGYEHHGKPAYDASYSGIALRFLTWAALLFNDPVMTARLEGELRLKAYQNLPEPDGTNFYATFLGPSHFSTATTPGAPTDQWCTHYRDAAGAMQSDEAAYLVFGGRRYAAYARPIGIRSESVMRGEIASMVSNVNAVSGQSMTNPLARVPDVWAENHWTEGLAYAGDYYKPGFYERALALADAQSPLLNPPFARRASFIAPFANDFLMVKLGEYGAILHTGPICDTWADHIAGLSGGSLSAFWTPETGSVILGLNRGSQSTNFEEWVSWSNWAVHAVSGVSGAGKPFSSARNRQPTNTFAFFGPTGAVATLSGLIGPHDGAMSAPAGAITGQVGYARVFRFAPDGLRITSSLTSDGADSARELWEMIPLHLQYAGQTGTAAAVVSFLAGDQWSPGTNSLVTNAAAVRITRFGESVLIAFDTPQRIKLSDESGVRASSLTRNLMIDLLGSGGAAVPLPASTAVQYRIYRPPSALLIRGESGDYGAPASPGYGRCTNLAWGARITNTVAAVAGETNGVRHLCEGWTLAGPDWQTVDSGGGTQAVFTLSTNRVLTWRWTNEYFLAVPAATNGSVDSPAANRWHREGSNAVLTALPDPGYAFDRWTGTVDTARSTDNPLTLRMDRVRTVRALFRPAGGISRQWLGGDWNDPNSWFPQGVPGADDVAALEGGTCVLAQATAAGGLSIRHATLLFTNWTARLEASGLITIGTGAVLTTPGAAINSELSNRVHLVCGSLAVEAGGQIEVSQKGYGGTSNSVVPAWGKGPGGGRGGGGGHGGVGGTLASTTTGMRTGGVAYASAQAPDCPGSSGGVSDTRVTSGAGGGVVRIDCGGAVVVEGLIAADGGPAATYAGGGSGGSIRIACRTFGGAGGLVSARGGAGYNGGGAGGRIAILADPEAQGIASPPGLKISALGGTTTALTAWRKSNGDLGTVYLSCRGLLGDAISHDGQLIVSNAAGLAWETLTVSNGAVAFRSPLSTLSVLGTLTIAGPTGYVEVGAGGYYTNSALPWLCNLSTAAPRVAVDGDLRLADGGRLRVYAGSTNGSGDAAGGGIQVGNTLWIGEGAWLQPWSNPTNGGSVRIRCGSLIVEGTNAGINANEAGYAGGWHTNGLGPGGSRKGGGGYGGKGGAYAAGEGGGPATGSSNAPLACGSGGGGSDTRPTLEGGSGGGLIWVEAGGEVRVNGTLTAQGGFNVTYGGGGSGGAIDIRCARFSGLSGGLLTVDGGPAAVAGGGGGGGRIAVHRYRYNHVYAGGYSVAGGTGSYEAGSAGTLVLDTLRPRGTLLLLY